MDVPGQGSQVQPLLDEAKTLVSQLYNPVNTGNPAKIKAIQEQLQTLQRSPQAWLIANYLLSDQSTDLRFFGALTFTVKINQDWQQLSENEIQEVLARLIDHFVFLVNGGEQALVIRKLASSLATIFLKPKAPWTRAIKSLAASLANGKYVPEQQCQSFDLQNAILPAMPERYVASLLSFCNILGEEINRSSESRKPEDADRISQNVEDAFALVNFVLYNILQQRASGNTIPEGPGTETINSYHSWMSVRSAFPSRDAVSTSQPDTTTNYVIQTLNIPSLSKSAGQVLVEILDWRDNTFKPDHLESILEYLVSDTGSKHVMGLLDADYDEENMTYLELLLAYASLKQRDLLTKTLDRQHARLLELLHTAFRASGFAAIEDMASPLLVEWWTEVADDLQEIMLEAEDQSAFAFAKQNLARAATNCFAKLHWPDLFLLREWSDDDRAEFASFRRDVCDFLLAIYPMLGVELVQVFQERATQSLEQKKWTTFEAAIFCIAQLCEAVDENQHADQCLNTIFFSDEFARLCESNELEVPDKARQTLVDMFGKYRSYFERTHALLPRVLTFLFASLEVSTCASAASRSISYLCKSCRNALTFELPAFMAQFEQFRMKPTATTSTMEKVLEGIAAIVQTLPSDEEKTHILEGILKHFHEQAMLARDQAARGLVDPARYLAHMVLRCVASIGRGLRTENEIALDGGPGEDSNPYPPTFWNAGNGAASQNLIMQCMQLLVTDFPLDVAIIEAACDILKAGYTERTGPYVFPPMVTVNFVKSIPFGSAGTDMVMGTASAFLASHGAHPEHVREETVALIVHVYGSFCWMHEKPEFYDPEVANSGMDFLTRLLPRYHPYLFALTSTPPEPSAADADGQLQRPPVLQAILNFTLLSLQGTDPLPLRSASQFWVSTINLPTEVESVQVAIRDSLPALCRILIVQVAGRCARSDLDHLCEVLRRVIFKHQGHARPHLATALSELPDTGAAKSEAEVATVRQERQRFLASLIAARGAKSQTAQLTRTFWMKSRGTGFDYVR
ncbi:putative importin 13 [Aspergillus melleus]|uniref:putative importin 13 n=1 Tax=Aspergillus melleus TaxID=138277 RepID=UPI001E8CAAA9|nr:member of the karyopherin-beta [Aspergillus melleus]KAH8433135.1 member of the karyopherin-beta [Aspergillus melleus]